MEHTSRLTYVKVLAEWQRRTVIPANVSKAVAKACRPLYRRHIRTRPYTPETEGRADRCIQTLCKQWAYGMAFQNSEERVSWLPPSWRAMIAPGSTQS